MVLADLLYCGLGVALIGLMAVYAIALKRA